MGPVCYLPDCHHHQSPCVLVSCTLAVRGRRDGAGRPGPIPEERATAPITRVSSSCPSRARAPRAAL
jgi:hypothetical protein